VTKTRVRPEAVGYGDMVELEGHVYIVTSIDGPDSHGAFDLYLMDKSGTQHHKVVTSAVELFYDES
jgi:hypothetical protein